MRFLFRVHSFKQNCKILINCTITYTCSFVQLRKHQESSNEISKPFIHSATYCNKFELCFTIQVWLVTEKTCLPLLSAVPVFSVSRLNQCNAPMMAREIQSLPYCCSCRRGCMPRGAWRWSSMTNKLSDFFMWHGWTWTWSITFHFRPRGYFGLIRRMTKRSKWGTS